MEAIILAGGFGTRLRPLTYTRAKSLLPILNKPMLTYITTALPKEVDKVILAVNYRKDQIEAFFRRFDIGREVIVNDEKEPLGTGGAVKFAEEHITDRFFVLNADIISSLHLDDMIAYHIKKKATATISLWPVKNVSEFGVVDMKEDGNVIGFVEKPKPQDAPSDLINAGAYLLEPSVLDYIDPGRLVSMEKEIFPQLISDTGRFYGYQFPGYWVDVGRIQSYIDVNKFLLTHQHISHLVGDACTIEGTLSSSCVGDKVIVGNHAKLESVVVFDEARIGQHSSLNNCVIGEGCTIGDKTTLTNVVVGDHETVPSETTKTNTAIWSKPIPKGFPQKQIGNVIGE